MGVFRAAQWKGKLVLWCQKLISRLALEEKPKNLQNIALFKMQTFGGFWTLSPKTSLDINFCYHITNFPFIALLWTPHMPILQQCIFYLSVPNSICFNILSQYRPVGCSEQCNEWVSWCCGVKNLFQGWDLEEVQNLQNFAFSKVQHFGVFGSFSPEWSLEINV